MPSGVRSRQDRPRAQPQIERGEANPDIDALEKHLTEQLGLRVEISFSGKGGTLRIHYSDLDQLDGLLVRLQGA